MLDGGGAVAHHSGATLPNRADLACPRLYAALASLPGESLPERNRDRAHSQPTAITLRSPYCLDSVPRTPQRTLRPRTLSPMNPKQPPLSRATRAPGLPHARPAHDPSLPRVRAISPRKSALIPQFRHGP